MRYCMFQATTSELRGEPSWNLTPCRMVRVMDLLATSSFQAVASQGISSPLAPVRKSGSRHSEDCHQLFIPRWFRGSPRLTPSLVKRLNLNTPPYLGVGSEGAGD